MSSSAYQVCKITGHVALFFLLGLALNCWKHQEHEITAPVTPVYTLSGNVSDVNSSQSLAGIEVFCQPGELLFRWQLKEPMTVTDSTGYYAFELCPGNYTLYFYREGFPVGEKRVVMAYSSREMNYRVAKVWWTSERYHLPGTLGIVWINSNKAALVSTFRYDDKACYRIFTGNFSTGFLPIGSQLFSKENPAFYGLIRRNGMFQTIGGTFSTPKIYQVNEYSGQVAAEFPAPHRLRDLTDDGEYLWSTASNDSIYKLDLTGNQRFHAFCSPGTQTTGIGWDGVHLWVGASDNKKRLYKLAPSGALFQTWQLFFRDESENILSLNNLSYLAFAPDTTLWVVDSEWIYHFSTK